MRAIAGLWGMSQAQSVALAEHCRPLSARRGEVIAQRGALLPSVLVLCAGSVKLSLRGADGDERVLRIVSAGESFGEPTALLRKPCLYDAIALTDAKLVSIASTGIFALLGRDHRFARALVLALAERSYTVLTELEAATTQRGAQRLAGYLTSLPKRNGARGGATVHLPVSKTIVAALLGMKKETLSRLLRQFTAEGVIGMTRREIDILDPAKLSAAAHERVRA
ncbi:MAG TPA: Crp/Fnr family transcriptional regulator [Burkholderiales bacterium]|nr:Crp/Fnr family transcriptional regulator [Burkholderiales bacterium]